MTEAEWLASEDPSRMLASLMTNVPLGNGNTAPSDRKLRLFACACCRAVWDGTPCERCESYGSVHPDCFDCHGTGRIGGLTDPRSRRAVETAEAFTEGWATEEELRLGYVKGNYGWLAAVPPAVQAALLRSIVGNPFHRPPKWKFCPGDATTWCTPNVLSLAAAIQGGEKCSACWNTYLKQNCTLCFGLGRTPFVSDPAAWAVLGDALEEAGVTDLAILNHCRGLTPCRLPFCRGGYWKHSGDPNTYPTKCHECSGSGWRPALVPHVRGDWVIDLLTGKE